MPELRISVVGECANRFNQQLNQGENDTIHDKANGASLTKNSIGRTNRRV